MSLLFNKPASGQSMLESKNVLFPFSKSHKNQYHLEIICSTMKTFLQAYIHEMRNNFSRNLKNIVFQKGRKLMTLVPK